MKTVEIHHNILFVLVTMMLLFSYMAYSREIGGAVESTEPIAEPVPEPAPVQQPVEQIIPLTKPTTAQTQAVDSDDDGIPDWWETENCLDPHFYDDARSLDYDFDRDGMDNLEEYTGNTNPNPAGRCDRTERTRAGKTVTQRTASEQEEGPIVGEGLEEINPDFNGDGRISFDDFLLFAGAFGKKEGDSDFDTKFDLNSDGKVGFGDFLIFASKAGKGLAKAIRRLGKPALLVGDFNEDGCVNSTADFEFANQELRNFYSQIIGVLTEDDIVGRIQSHTIDISNNPQLASYGSKLAELTEKYDMNGDGKIFFSWRPVGRIRVNLDIQLDSFDRRYLFDNHGNGCEEEETVVEAAKPVDPNLAIMEQAILEDDPELCKTITDEGLVIECIIETAVQNNNPDDCSFIEHDDEETQEAYQVQCLTKIVVVNGINKGFACGNGIVEEGEECDGDITGDIAYCNNCVVRQDSYVRRTYVPRSWELNDITLPSPRYLSYVRGNLLEHDELRKTGFEREMPYSQDDLKLENTQATLLTFKVTDPFVTSVDIEVIYDTTPVKGDADGVRDWSEKYERVFSNPVIPITPSYTVDDTLPNEKVTYDYRPYPGPANTKAVLEDVPVVDGYAYILLGAKSWDGHNGKKRKIKSLSEFRKRLAMTLVEVDYAKIVRYNLGIPKPTTTSPVPTDDVPVDEEPVDEENFDDECEPEDDDCDGEMDEDWVDGEDNDGDGLVDEDPEDEE